MNKERDELLKEANDLGLEFHSNIKTFKLKNLILEAKGEPLLVDEKPPASPKEKPEEPGEEEEEEEVETTSIKSKPALSVYAKKRKRISDAKKKALALTVVTITNKDNRENDVMTTAYLSFENQHFGMSKNVPLDIPVELEAALIGIAENTMMTLHKDEIVGGKRTGNKIPVRTKKYAVSYGKPSEY